MIMSSAVIDCPFEGVVEASQKGQTKCKIECGLFSENVEQLRRRGVLPFCYDM